MEYLQRFGEWFTGATFTQVVAALVAAAVLCSGFVLRGDVGDGKGRRFEEATLIMDIADGEVSQLEIQRGVERVSLTAILALRDGT